MTRMYTSAFALLLAGSVTAQIPNASFEDWSQGDPIGWNTSNLAAPSVSQTTDAHAGSSAARLDVFTINLTTYGATLISQQFPQLTRETAFRGWYKGGFQGGDYLMAAAFVVAENGEELQAASGSLINSTNVYTQFSFPMVDTNEGIPNYGVVSLLIYGTGGSFSNTTPGTWAQVDDLSWGAAVSIEEIESTGTVLENIYPNPTNGNPALVQFNMARPGHVLLEVFDLTGKKVSTVLNQVMPTGHYRAEMNTVDLSAGVYVCRMLVDGQLVQSLRFVN